MHKIFALPFSFLLTLACLSAAGAADDAADLTPHRLQVEARTATINLTPGNAQRNTVPLPTLDVVFQLKARCAAPYAADMLSLTLADSRRFLDKAALGSGEPLTDIQLSVPAGQLAPLLVGDFCRRGESDESPAAVTTLGESLTVAATLSASAALLCVSSDNQQMIYAATPLDVTFRCVADDAGPTPSAE